MNKKYTKNMDLIKKDTQVFALSDSPLFNVKSTLKYLRIFLGFPLVSTNEEWNEFAFVPAKEYLRLMVFLILCLFPWAFISYLFSDHIDEFRAMFQLSNLDIIVELSMVQTLPILSSIVYFVTFKNNHKKQFVQSK